MNASLPDDLVSIGEGFAYFRWHYLTLPSRCCRGINDRTPGFGLNVCVPMWRKLRRG